MIQLENEFRVDLPVEEAWNLLTDLPRVARCLPGASLDEIVDGEYRGGLSTRIGPISAKYRGTAAFREYDEVGRRVVIEARGREEKGTGSANALITAVLTDHGGGTVVTVSSELRISGRAAQFGRSLLAEVSNTMLDEFVRRLESMIAGDQVGTPSGADRPSGEPSETVRGGNVHQTPKEAPGIEQLDVLTTIALPMLRKAAVPLGAAFFAGTLGIVLGRLGRRRADLPPTVFVYPCRLPHDGLGS